MHSKEPLNKEVYLEDMSLNTLGQRAAIAMNVARQLDRMLEAVSATALPQAASEIQTVRAKLFQNSARLAALVGDIYSEVYTPAELEALVGFLESPAGQAMLEKQPQVEQKVQQASAAFLQGLKD